MSETEETLQIQPNTIAEIVELLQKAIVKIDSLEKNTNAQLETIRTGIVANSADFDRLTAKVLNLSADVKDLTEEVRQNHKTLTLK